jgi:hypothetical protein
MSSDILIILYFLSLSSSHSLSSFAKCFLLVSLTFFITASIIILESFCSRTDGLSNPSSSGTLYSVSDTLYT